MFFVTFLTFTAYGWVRGGGVRGIKKWGRWEKKGVMEGLRWEWRGERKKKNKKIKIINK